ncbi:gluconokinase [Isoptericola sp. S6320L]|uniref:gluconokinase n=1 Tax=Isoptericola sp. S6320L TaxID=2926411 RepID=UPI001FF27B11|nr:gluconokinase [Isoptericola sp. S6320L]MCK0115730.1 gluconokinase [Isoptericola sp. S6320L]
MPADVRGVVVMGVSGSGKSTVGTLLASRWQGRFVDGDDLHPPANVARMAAGHPLTNADRSPWLQRVGTTIAAAADAGQLVVTACSALRRTYRDELRRTAGGDLAFVHLTATREVLAERVLGRHEHFMPPALLDSQLATLEPLQDDETGLALDITEPPDLVVERVATWHRGHAPAAR